MPANPIDRDAYRRVLALHVDGSRHRRYSADRARRAWYAERRRERYRRYVLGLC